MRVPRLRQVALVARDLTDVRGRLEDGVGLHDPFSDSGVGQFGLDNVVYEAGSDFLEVVSPVRDDTSAGRYLDRNGDGGYMAIFQVPDVASVRARLPDLGIRVVWEVNLADIASSHLHPKDVPGAIVSVDAAEPPGSWRWGGPRWIGKPPADPHSAGGITSITVAVEDPDAVRGIWSSVLGCELDPLPSGQSVTFVEGTGGIVEVRLTGGRSGQAVVGSAVVRTTGEA